MMKKILHLTASIRGEESMSNQLSAAIVEQLVTRYPGSEVQRVDLATTLRPHFSAHTLGAFYAPAAAHTPAQQQAIQYADKSMDDLLAANIIVIGVPVYNFGIPDTLKSWIDHIVRSGVTFRYHEGKPEGLLKNKQVYLAITSGWLYTAGPMKDKDYVDGYLRTVLNYIGITDITTFRAEGLAIPAYQQQALPRALESVRKHMQALPVLD